VDIDAILRSTLEDGRMSRTEGKALRQVLEDLSPDRRNIAKIRTHAFRIAMEAASRQEDREVIEWLEEIMRILFSTAHEGMKPSLLEASFSPGLECVKRISGLFKGAATTADVCVYTITDDRISRSIKDAHRRGVGIRIITDDDKVGDTGSDIEEFRRAGVEVITDRATSHMHHKFALFDDRLVVTGSYNWTRSAADENQENLVISDDARLVGAFRGEFERLWERWA
jgi:mitochondrial cardiolipin hydrolase